MSSDDPADGSERPTGIVRQKYRDKVGHLSNINDFGMRSHAVRRTLLDRPPAEALYWLDQMVRGAVWGRQADMDALVGLAFWLAQFPRGGDHYDFIGEVYRIAHDHSVQGVLLTLRNAPPQLELAEEANLPDVRLPLDRDDLPVGSRRSLARKADRDLIDRLILDPHPMVISNLLENPDLTESDVLRVTSRRPTKPEILEKVVASERWFGRLDVRKSLVMNPYHPTGRSLKILATIGIDALRQVRFGSDLHPALAEAAEYLVDMRETHTSPWEV